MFKDNLAVSYLQCGIMFLGMFQKITINEETFIQPNLQHYANRLQRKR